jgi:hypothetical protein
LIETTKAPTVFGENFPSMINLGEPREAQQVRFNKFKGTRRGYHPECLVFYHNNDQTPPMRNDLIRHG